MAAAVTDRNCAPPSRGSRNRALAALFIAGLGFVCTQMTCAEVTGAWTNDDPPNMSMDGGAGDGGDNMWRCFMGVPATETELLNRCTEAERVERASAIPADKWDGKTLPFQ